MPTLKENKEEIQGGPWEAPLTASGARSHPTQSPFQEAFRTHHSRSKWAKCGMLMMGRNPKGRK
eukprot:432828-Prorocentrum_lima.AAC.1